MDQKLARKWRWRRLLPVLIPLIVGLLWYSSQAVGYVASLRLFVIPSGSMAPAILPGDRITVDHRGGSPKRTEIWTFSGPNQSTLIKRVIGLPGETIEVAGGRVLINGQPLSEPYLNAPMTYSMAPVQLDPEHYFVMGDSRNASADSHVWGPLHRSKFIGRAEHRVWPGSRVGPLR